ncbi:MAG: DUF58 domain-containing protein [Kofleriaceae bacterium]|nr:DUF58 domain-containing protein [Kofleriaceae bacterium]MBP9165764.1 DUF58 domain-containing protein [Kofleriaceae bacterium]MBP9857913.1 DUF58 domain-containing protein [Kofleriaceae bacterium]
MRLDPALLARLGPMAIKARVIVDSVLAGQHRARRHGSSIEFAEHKEYSPGDELRHVDWKALAKLDRYYVKRFEQESQLTAYLVLDASGSMRFAGAGPAKVDYGASCLAALAYLIGREQDQVGLYAFGARPRHVPPRAKGHHLTDLFAVLDEVLADPDGGDASPAEALERVGELCRRRRSLIVLASDLFDPDDETIGALTRLKARRHDVAVAHVLAPEERTLPYDGLTRFEDLEGDHRLLANPTAIRADYIARMDGFLAATRERLAAAGIDYHLTPTDRALDDAVVAIVGNRRSAGERR